MVQAPLLKFCPGPPEDGLGAGWAVGRLWLWASCEEDEGLD